MNKVVSIRQIVQLKQVLRRWRSLSLSRGAAGAGYVDLHEEAFGSGGGSTRPVPPGHLAVYVGAERQRFVIPTRFLNLPVFAALLLRAAEEYGYATDGGLAIPCDPGFFGWLVGELERDGTGRLRSLALDAFLARFADDVDGVVASPCRGHPSPSKSTA